MSSARFHAVSQRIEGEKTLRHLGTARVGFDYLSFPHSKQPGERDPANTERLERLFRVEGGCRRDDVAHRIPAIVQEDVLRRALEFRLECLRGRHRVEAARRILCEQDRWWTVDFYPAEISPDLKCALIEEYTSESKPDDGEFYYKIREYQGRFGARNAYFEDRWWARLASISDSTNKRDRLRQLDRHRDLSDAFDAFSDIPAMYGGMRLSVLNKVISMKCREELLSALGFVKDFFFKGVFGQDKSMMRRLTRADVEALQLTAPGACRSDAHALVGRIKSGEILGAFDEDEKERIWARICSATTDCLVPSLHAFFENLKYIEGPLGCMKQILRPKRGETIERLARKAFADGGAAEGECLIQTSTTGFVTARAGADERFEIAYRQLWLGAFREHREITEKVRQRLAGPRGGDPNETVLFEFASLANRLGFRTDEIQAILRSDPDRAIARRLLRSARDPGRFVFGDIERCVGRIVDLFREAQPMPDGHGSGNDEWEPADRDLLQRELPPTRCGRLNDADQLRDKSSMFLTKLYQSIAEQSPSVTSFFVQRSLYFFFFGKKSGFDLFRDLPSGTGEVGGDRSSGGGGAHLTSAQYHQASVASMASRPGESEMAVEGRSQDECDAARQRDLEQQLKAANDNLESARNQAELLRQELESVKGIAAEQQRLTSNRLAAAGSKEKELQLKVARLTEEEQQKRAVVEELEAQERERKSALDDLEKDKNDKTRELEELTAKVVALRQESASILPVIREPGWEEPGPRQASADEAPRPGRVRLEFMTKGWTLAHRLDVDPEDTRPVQRMCVKYMRKGMGIFDHNLQVLTPVDCYQRVTDNGTRQVFLLPQWEVERRLGPANQPDPRNRRNQQLVLHRAGHLDNGSELPGNSKRSRAG